MVDKQRLNDILPYQSPSPDLYTRILADIPVAHATQDEIVLARWLRVAGLALVANIAIPSYAMASTLPSLNLSDIINTLALGLGG